MTQNLSILIITRNRAKMLERCLNSLVVQTRLPDEVIVVDNLSTDNTKKVILSFKKGLPIKYVQEKQIGTSYARNKSIKVASGTLLLMLDDDCQADRFWVEKMIAAHKKYPNAWVIQGKTFSLPKKSLYSLAVEFSRLLYVRNSANKIISLRSFFRKYFTDEIEILMCDTKSFSIKTSYLKKYKLSFDTHFSHYNCGEDTDLGRQILQKNGLIIFCPSVIVAHWERSTLAQFLEQCWYIGRASARIVDKWKTTSFTTKITLRLGTLPALLLFCKVFNQWRKLPILMGLLFLAKLYRLNGWFYERRLLSLGKR